MNILLNKWGGITPLKKGGKHWFNSLVSADFRERRSEAV